VKYYLCLGSNPSKGGSGNLALVVRVHKRILMTNHGRYFRDRKTDPASRE
jgi:hypothetical protein